MEQFRQLVLLVLVVMSNLLIVSAATCQVDSIRYTLHNAKDDDERERLLMAWDEVTNFSDTVTLGMLLNELNRIATVKENKPLLAKYFSFKGSYFLRRGKLDSAIHAFNRSNAIGKPYGPSSLRARNYGGLGNMWGRKGDYTKKLIYLDSATEILKYLKPEGKLHITIASDRANTFLRLGRELDFLTTYWQLIKKTNGTSMQKEVIALLSNMGAFYGNKADTDKKFIDSAVFYVNRALALAMLAKDERQIATIRMNLGTIMSLKNDFDPAIVRNMLLEAKATFLKSGDLFSEARATYQLAVVCAKENDFKTSIRYGNAALEICKKQGFREMMVPIQERLYNNYLALQDYKNALFYFQAFKQIQDSVAGAEVKNKIAQFEVTAALKEKDREIEAQRASAEKRKYVIGITIVLILFLVTALVFGVILYLYKQKIAREQLALLNAEVSGKAIEQENLRLKLQQQSKELVTKTISLSERKIFIENLLRFMDKEDDAEKPLHQIRKQLKNESSEDAMLKEFRTYFETTFPEFFEKIEALANDLTQRELRLLAFIKIGMGTKEIANMLHVEPNTVKISRYRLKKKLFPDSDLTLEQLLQKF